MFLNSHIESIIFASAMTVTELEENFDRLEQIADCLIESERMANENGEIIRAQVIAEMFEALAECRNHSPSRHTATINAFITLKDYYGFIL